MRYSARKLRIMKPAPASSTSVSASSATISALGPAPGAHAAGARCGRPPSFSTSLTSVFDTCSAGARPKTTPVREADRGEEREDAAVHRELHPVRLADVRSLARVEQPDADDRQAEAEQRR